MRGCSGKVGGVEKQIVMALGSFLGNTIDQHRVVADGGAGPVLVHGQAGSLAASTSGVVTQLLSLIEV